jgi:hypothetical protein
MTKAPARKAQKQAMVTLMVPMLASNWALCLATGFVGGKPRHDCGLDAQALYPDGVVGCVGKLAPWLIAHGEPGDRVVLKVALPAAALRDMQGFVVAAGLHRVTLVKECQFPTEAAKANFEATFGAFPDVPARLVPLTVKKLAAAKGAALAFETDTPPSDGLAAQREALDAACGWVAGLAGLFSDASMDGVFNSLKGQAGAGLPQLAASALQALAPQSASVDVAVWSAVAEQRLAPREDRSGDRRALLEAVAATLARSEGGSAEASAWLSKVSDVISAKCDLPPLGDDGAIGRRAALAAVLGDSSGRLPLGPRVGALCALVSQAATGFTRLPAAGLKDDPGRLDALLALAAGLVASGPAQLEVVPGEPLDDFSAEDRLVANGQALAVRRRPAPGWIAALQEAARSAGSRLAQDPVTGLPCLAGEGGAGQSVLFEERQGPGGRHLRAWVVLAPARPKAPGPAQMKAALEAAWDRGFHAGIRSGAGAGPVCAFTDIPLDPFDAPRALASAAGLASACAGFQAG